MNWKKLLSNPMLPNLITLARLLAIPAIILILTFKKATPLYAALSAIIYLAAALTDLLDGYLARRYNQVSNLGKFLDPLADKLLVSAAMIMLISVGRAPAWVVFLIIAREFAVTGLRAIAVERGLVISASSSGKQKTLFQNIALFCLLWHYPLFWLNTYAIGMAMLYVALVSTYWSGGLYFYHYFKSAQEMQAVKKDDVNGEGCPDAQQEEKATSETERNGASEIAEDGVLNARDNSSDS